MTTAIGSQRAQTNRRRRSPNRRLQELRINSGMAPSDLAYRAGVSAKTIRLAEAGFIPGPRIQFSVAQVFSLSPLELWPLESQVRP